MKDPDYHDSVVDDVINAANVIEVNVNMEETDEDFPTFA